MGATILPEPGVRPVPPDPLVVLSVCPDLDRLEIREQTLASAGYRVLSASSLPAAWALSQYCDFAIVVLDQEYAWDADAAAFKQRYKSLLLNRNAPGRQLLREVARRLGAGALGTVH